MERGVQKDPFDDILDFLDLGDPAESELVGQGQNAKCQLAGVPLTEFP